MAMDWGATTSELINWQTADITRMRAGTEFRNFRRPSQLEEFALFAGAQALALINKQPVSEAVQFLESEGLWTNSIGRPRTALPIGELMTSAPLGEAFDVRKLRVMAVRRKIALPVTGDKNSGIELDFLAAGLLHERHTGTEAGAVGVRFVLSGDHQGVRKKQSPHPIVAPDLNSMFPNLVTFRESKRG